MFKKEHNKYLAVHAAFSYGITLIFFIGVLIGHFRNRWLFMDTFIFFVIGIEAILLCSMLIVSVTRYRNITHNSFRKIGFAIIFHSIYEMVVITLYISSLEDDDFIRLPSLFVVALLASLLYLGYSKWIEKNDDIINNLVTKWRCVLPRLTTYWNRLSIAAIIWFIILLVFQGDIPLLYIAYSSLFVMTLFVFVVTIQIMKKNQPRLWYAVVGLYSIYIIVILRFLSVIRYFDIIDYERMNNAILVLYIAAGAAFIGYCITFVLHDEYKLKSLGVFDVVMIAHLIVLYVLDFARSSGNALIIYHHSIRGYVFELIEVAYYSILVVYILIMIYRLLAPYITKLWYNKAR